MRASFFVLLLANLGFLAWAHWVDTPREAKTSDAIARLPRLKLVGELSPSGQPGSAGDSGTALRKVALGSSSDGGPLRPAGSGAAGAGTGGSAASLAAAARCVSLGPFNDLSNAARAAGALHTRGFAPQQRAAEGETWEGFWVSIGSVGDDAAATRIMKSLERSGIKDARLMPDTGDGRRISVGLYSERDRAERRAKAIEKLGLKTDVTERTQPGTVYWVDLTLKPSDGSIPVQDLMSDAAGTNSRLSVQACPLDPSAAPGGAPTTPGTRPAEHGPAGAHVPPTTVAGTRTPKLN